MIGTRFMKSGYDDAAYTEAAAWCNANNARIIEHDEYYEVEPFMPEDPALSREEQIRARLNELSHVSQEILLGLATREDYADEIDEIASLYNELYMIEEGAGDAS